MSKLIISLSPHAHGGDSVERNMYNVLIALVPALLVSFYYFGLGSVVVCSVSVAACVFFEWAITRYMLRRPTTLLDGSACITGLLLGMNLPSNFPIWMIIVGALVAIGIGKMTFGGLGCNPFNPAIVGRCFLLVSFPAAMTSWPVAGQQMAYTDAVTGATPLSLMKTAIKTGDVSVLQGLPDTVDMLLGNVANGYGAGTIGEVCALALIAGLIWMLWRRVITWHIPVIILATVFVLSGALHAANPVYAHPMAVVLSGGLMLGAIFMATDYATSPVTKPGQLIFGLGCGLLTCFIRRFGSYPEGVCYSILIMNCTTWLLDKYIRPVIYGAPKKEKKEAAK